MKSYTDIEQSKKLAEILSLESADSHYVRQTHDFRGNTVDGKWSHPKYGNPNSRYANYIVQNFSSYETIPCWSLAVLLSVLPYPSLHKTFSGWRCDSYNKEGTTCKLGESSDNPIDACYETIMKLHELKML